MVTLSSSLSRFAPIRALVIGDLMLDVYTQGEVKRVSPEAPVMVLKAGQDRSHAGGAGNVALNLMSLGADVRLLGRVGHDRAGEQLLQELKGEGIDTQWVVTDHTVPTPVKNRLISGGQQLLRIDHEEVKLLPEGLEQQVLDALPDALEDIDIVAISDYAKGLLTPTLLREVMASAWSRGIPVIVDPKGGHFHRYSGCTLIKPNLKEAREAAGLPDSASLNQVAQEIRKQVQCEYLVVTLAEGGIAVFDSHMNRGDFPARVREVNDVTGAGDTVLSMLTCALANKLPIAEAAQVANVAAGIAIEQIGCVRITLPELARRLLDYDVVHKVFDEEHLYALKKAVAGRRFVIVGVESRHGITGEMHQQLRQLTKEGRREVILYIRDEEPDEPFLLLLEALKEVSFIVLKRDSLLSLADQLHPEECFRLDPQGLHSLEETTALL